MSYIELQVCFWSWITISGRNMNVIPKMFGDRNSVGGNPERLTCILIYCAVFQITKEYYL